MFKEAKKAINKIKSLEKIANKRANEKLKMLVIWSSLASLMEAVSIGLLFPTVTLLMNKTGYNEIEKNFEKIGIKIPQIAIDSIIIAIAIVTILGASAIKIKSNKKIHKEVNEIGVDISRSILENLFKTKTRKYKEIDQSEITAILVSKIDNIVQYYLNPIIQLGASALAIGAYLTIMIITSGVGPILILTSILIIYAIISISTKKRIVNASEKLNNGTQKLIQKSKIYNNDYYSIKINEKESIVTSNLVAIDQEIRSSRAEVHYLNLNPRYIVEAITISILLLVILYVISVKSENEFSSIVPLAIILAVGAQKLLPLMQTAYAALNNLHVGLVSVSEVEQHYDQMKNNLNTNKYRKIKKIDENIIITLDNAILQLEDGKELEINKFNVLKGSYVVLQGASGVGKTSFLLTLFDESMENMFIKGKPLRYIDKNKIEYIKQTSVVEEVAIKNYLEYYDINSNLTSNSIKSVMKLVGFDESVIEKKIINGRINSGGANFSGGEIQRINLARSLLRKPTLLVIDEGLSGVSVEMHEKIIMNIREEFTEIAIIEISHKPKNQKLAPVIYNINENKLERYA